MQEPGIVLSTVNHLHIIRAAYGGAYLGIAAFFSLAAVGWVDRRSGLMAVLVIFGGFALGRLVSLVCDGWPVPLYLGVLAAELFFAACAARALRSSKQA